MQLYRRKNKNGKVSSKWSFSHHEGGARLEKSTGESQREIAESVALKMIAEWRAQRSLQKAAAAAGIELPSFESEENLVKSVAGWVQSLKDRRVSKQRQREGKDKVLRMMELMDIQSLDQITPDRIASALRNEGLSERINQFNERQISKPESERKPFKKPSTTTIKNYHGSLSTFFNWLIRQGKWDKRNPCVVVDLPSHESVYERKALSLREIGYLLEYVPRYRRLVYLVAATTGLRRRELAALRWDDIDLDEQRVLVRASISKNSKSAVLPIVMDSLAEWRAYREDIEPFYPKPIRGRAIGFAKRRFDQGFALPPIPQPETLRKDCAHCNIKSDWTRARIDFHSLRVSFVSGLDEVGANLQKSQKLARHSDPKLTSNIYTKSNARALADEVEKLGQKIRERRA